MIMLTHGKYLIDTDVCIELVRKNPMVVEHVREAGASDCKISNITLAEMYFGAFKSGKQKHFDDVVVINRLFESYPIMYLRKYGELRWMLEKNGQKIGDMDMFIAATALEEDLILVTGNTAHFERIPGLKVENWVERE